MREKHLDIYKKIIDKQATPETSVKEKGNFRLARPAAPEHTLVLYDNRGNYGGQFDDDTDWVVSASSRLYPTIGVLAATLTMFYQF